jgi:gas vesicle protein
LVGGLVGGTLGTLAAALANRKTSKGFNHSAEGVGRAFKTIGQGLGQAAQGVGEAAKSVSEGVTYAVVGSAQDITEGTQQ